MKMLRKLIFITIICAFIVTPALADMRITENISAGVGHANGGGEFGITVLNAASGGGDPIGIYGIGESFMTFCLERNEYISGGYGLTHYVTLSSAAMAGGISGGSPDPLSAQSAWLYSQWLDGGITYNATNANAVQEAIWRLEGESSSTGGDAATLISNANAAVTGGWINTDISVMNLWANVDHTGARQDMLVRVPVPGALLLGLLGLSAAGIKLRKFA